MEGIVRRARRANPDMDIVMMHFACTDKLEDYENGKTPEVIQSFDKVAEHYGVPTLDITEEIYERIKRGEFTWKDDIKGVHPSPFGQQLYADSIERLLDEAWSGKPRPVVAHAMPEKLDPASYSEGKLFAPRIAKKLNGFAVETDYDAAAEGGKVRAGWNERPQLIGHKPGDSFDLTFKGSAVAIQVIAGPKAGIIEHSVDGSDWVEQDLFVAKNSFKLHLNRIYILRDGLDPEKEHTLTVRISEKRNELSKGNNCRIVYFGLNGGYGLCRPRLFRAPKNKTPRIDQMAKEGRRFTSFYVASSVCSASRAALLTGCYPRRVGVPGVFFPNRGSHGLDPKHFTIAELLKSVGYKTLAAGKWHLGDEPKFLPTNQGFDSFYGVPYSNDMYPAQEYEVCRRLSLPGGHYAGENRSGLCGRLRKENSRKG